jgi:hypothetical protein
VNILKCKRCKQPFTSGETRFGSPETGWQHPGECPPKIRWGDIRTHHDAPANVSHFTNRFYWAEGYNDAVANYYKERQP